MEDKKFGGSSFLSLSPTAECIPAGSSRLPSSHLPLCPQTAVLFASVGSSDFRDRTSSNVFFLWRVSGTPSFSSGPFRLRGFHHLCRRQKEAAVCSVLSTSWVRSRMLFPKACSWGAWWPTATPTKIQCVKYILEMPRLHPVFHLQIYVQVSMGKV